MKRVIRLTESELNDIVRKTILEQSQFNDPKRGNYTWRGPGPGKQNVITVERPTTLGASLFLNGVDKIDTNSQEFKNGVSAIQNVAKGNKGLTVTVVGGASAVGKQEGYDNDALAKRRSQNFINAVKPLVPGVNFVSKSVVGVATVKNSSEANKEQFVRLQYTVKSDQYSDEPAVDNTAVYRQNQKLKDLPKKGSDGGKTVRICFDIPYTMVPEVNQKYGQYAVNKDKNFGQFKPLDFSK